MRSHTSSAFAGSNGDTVAISSVALATFLGVFSTSSVESVLLLWVGVLCCSGPVLTQPLRKIAKHSTHLRRIAL